MRYAALLLLALCLPAQAEEVYVGIGPVCDTQEQMEQYVETFNGDPHQSVELVNAKHKPDVCVVGKIVYKLGEEVSVRRTHKLSASIRKITVIGAVMPQGVVPMEPMEQFTVFELKHEQAV